MPAVGPPAADWLDREQSRESGDLFGPAVGLADCRLSFGAAVMRISRFRFSATSSRIITGYSWTPSPRSSYHYAMPERYGFWGYMQIINCTRAVTCGSPRFCVAEGPQCADAFVSRCQARRRVWWQCRAGVVVGSKGIGRLIGCLVAQCPKFGICSVGVFRAALELRRFAQRWGFHSLGMGGVLCEVR